VVAAVLGGGVFGDHCSPVSDTTMVASMASASDHIDHVRTQLPYALTAGLGATVLYALAGLLL
jgi:Na+/H+ antiporter NhaC